MTETPDWGKYTPCKHKNGNSSVLLTSAVPEIARVPVPGEVSIPRRIIAVRPDPALHADQAAVAPGTPGAPILRPLGSDRAGENAPFVTAQVQGRYASRFPIWFMATLASPASGQTTGYCALSSASPSARAGLRRSRFGPGPASFTQICPSRAQILALWCVPTAGMGGRRSAPELPPPRAAAGRRGGATLAGASAAGVRSHHLVNARDIPTVLNPIVGTNEGSQLEYNDRDNSVSRDLPQAGVEITRARHHIP